MISEFTSLYSILIRKQLLTQAPMHSGLEVSFLGINLTGKGMTVGYLNQTRLKTWPCEIFKGRLTQVDGSYWKQFSNHATHVSARGTIMAPGGELNSNLDLKGATGRPASWSADNRWAFQWLGEWTVWFRSCFVQKCER